VKDIEEEEEKEKERGNISNRYMYPVLSVLELTQNPAVRLLIII